MPSQGQGFIGRNRKPRVHITYEDPYDSNQLIELPFVMGVMADLSGNASDTEKPEVGDRDFSNIDMDNFDKTMSSINPGIAMAVKNRLDPSSTDKMSVKLNFSKMEDFSPAAVARNVPSTRKLLEAREQLQNLLRYMDGKASASSQLKALLADPDMMAALKQRASEKSASTADADEEDRG